MIVIGPEIIYYIQWAGYALAVLSVFAKDWIPSWVPYLGKMRKTVDELKELINTAPTPNREFKANAIANNFKEAAKVLEDIESKV